MTISFSGLASGLDTSSWIESLTALKKAKVTTLTEEQKVVQTAKETLASIKSFFTSFRSLLEKVTDTKFNVASMDVFSQKLASSSNTNILTALATAEASECSYEIKVDKLAGSTQAVSGYKHTTTEITTTIATNNSLLKDLGVKAGNIGVTVNGKEEIVSITDKDTIGSFVNKLSDIGVNSFFNEKTGVFSMNLGSDKINDTDKTGIVDALHLSNVNHGYSTGQLKTEKKETVYNSADGSTKLSDLGVKAGTLVIAANGTDYDVTLDGNETMQDFLDGLKAHGIEATLKDGVFTLVDAEIKSDGDTGLKNAFGLSSVISSNVQQSGNLTCETIVTTNTTATIDTKLKDLAGGEGLKNGDTVLVKNANGNVSTITLTETSTIGDLVTGLNDAGLTASMGSDGKLSITGGVIVDGGKFDVKNVFGLEETSVNGVVTGNALTENLNNSNAATLLTTLGALGMSNGSQVAVFNDGTNDVSVTISSTMSLADFVSAVNTAAGSTVAKFDSNTSKITIEGLSISSNNTSEIASVLDLTSMVSSHYGTSNKLYTAETVTVTASRDSKLSDFGITDSMSTADRTITFEGVDGTFAGYSMTVTSNSTIGDILDYVNNVLANTVSDTSKKPSATIENGVLKLDNVKINNAALTNEFGLSSSTSTAVGNYLTKTIESTITGSSKLGDIIAAMGTENEVASGYTFSINGHSVSVSAETTLNDMMGYVNFSGFGTAGTYNAGGQFIINNGTVDGTVAKALGFTNTLDTTTVSATSGTLYAQTSAYADENTTFSDLGIASATFKVNDTEGKAIGSITVSGTQTLGSFLSDLNTTYGIAGNITDGKIKLNSSSGNVLEARELGITMDSSALTTIVTQNSTAPVTATGSEYATTNTTFSELGIDGKSIVLANQNGLAVQTLTLTGTIGDLFNQLNSNGIEGTISNGVMSFNITGDLHISAGDGMAALGITSSVTGTTTTYVGKTFESTVAVTYTINSAITGDTKLGDFLSLNSVETIVSTSSTGSTTISLNPASLSTYGVSSAADLTVNQFLSFLQSKGYTTSLSNDGKISISAGDRWLSGSIIDQLGITLSNTGFTTGVSATSSTKIVTSSPQTVSVGTTQTSTVQVTYGHTNTEYLTKMATVDITTTLESGKKFAISSIDDLEKLQQMVNYGRVNGATFVLANDIDASGATLSPIGTSASQSFNGKFDGNGYVIKNVTMETGSAAAEKYLGFFGYVSGAEIKNLGLENVNIRAGANSNYAGGLAGMASSSKISNCYVTGNVTSNSTIESDMAESSYTGGLVGQLSSGTITSCASSATVSAVAGNVGGFAGIISSGVVKQSFSTGNVHSSSNNSPCGGFIGSLDGGTISDSYSAGTVVASAVNNSNTGGFIGALKNYTSGGWALNNVSYYNNSMLFASGSSYTAVVSTTTTINNSATNAVCNGGTAAPSTIVSSLQGGKEKTMTESTTFAELGLTVNAYVKLSLSGVMHTYTVKTTDSVGSLVSYLNDNGFTASITDGKLTVAGSDSAYVEDWGSLLRSKIKFNSSYGYQESVIAAGTEATGDTKLTAIYDTPFSVVVNKKGEMVTIKSDPTMTVNDFVSKLKDVGSINASFMDSKLTLNFNEGVYIEEDTSGLFAQLNIANLETKCRKTMSASNAFNVDKTNTMTHDTTLGDLGVSVSTILLKNTSGSQTVKLDFTDATTLSGIISQLSSYGIEADVVDGKFKITGYTGEYVFDKVAPNLAARLKITNASTYQTTWNDNYANSDSSPLTVTTTAPISRNTKIRDIIGESNVAGNPVHIVNSSGSTIGTISLTADMTMGTFLDSLSSYGFTSSIDSDGRVYISSTNGCHIKDDSEYSQDKLLNKLNIGFAYNNTVSGYTNSDSNVLKTYSSVKATGTSKISDLITSDGTPFGTSSGINKLTVTTAGGTKIIAAVDTNATINDLLAEISSNGYSASFSNGVFHLNLNAGSEDMSSLTFGGNLASLFIDDSTISYNVNKSSLAENLKVQTTAEIDSSDKLSDLGITSGNVVIKMNDGNHTISVDSSSSFGDFFNKLESIGITSSFATSSGTFNLFGDGETSIVSAGSNIFSKLGISSFSTGGEYNFSSSALTTVNTTISTATSDMKISDLTNSAGDNLGITSGRFCIKKDGAAIATISVSSTDKLETLINKLYSYGVDAYVNSDGQLSFTTNGDITFDTTGVPDATNLLDALGLSVNKATQITQSGSLYENSSSESTAKTTTKLSDLLQGSYQAGFITVNKNGSDIYLPLSDDETIGSLMQKLDAQGFSTLFSNGKLTVSSNGNLSFKEYTGSEQASNALTLLGIQESNWKTSVAYDGTTLSTTSTNSETTKPTGTTLLKDLGISSGEFYIYNNGVRYKAMVSASDTIDDLKNTLLTFGISSGLLETGGNVSFVLNGSGDSYIAKSAASNASNICDVLFPKGKTTSYNYVSTLQMSETVTNTVVATETTLISDYDSASFAASAGELKVTVGENDYRITVTSSETFGSLIDKFKDIGIDASISNGNLLLQAGNQNFSISAISSNLVSNLHLAYSNDLGGYSASSATVEATTTEIVEKTSSVANNADMNTKLSLVNISAGSFALYRDGQKATIQIDEDDTFTDLRSKISDKNSGFEDVDMVFEDGKLKIFSKTDGVQIMMGSSVDTSNIASVLGLSSTNGVVSSARELYKVNATSVLTDSNLFRKGDVTEGTFTVGEAVFNIDSTTTLNDIISQINTSEKANATAYWDSVDGKMVISSRTSGAAFINIESGTSNFTDIMGFTSTDAAGVKRLNAEAQELGSNAKFSINGTDYTSTSNTVSSDISRIKGVTLNLKDISREGSVTVTITKDTDKVTDAIEQIVKSYNELIENVDKQLGSDGKLSDQSTLKLVRNQLRSLMTSSVYGNSTFKNLDSIGIGYDAASANNISTDNINVLHFDRDKFAEAYAKDPDALKELLVGTENNQGIFTKVEAVVESALKSVTGYFASAETSYTNEIKRYSTKIQKANAEVTRYKSFLENKFQSMDMIISNMRNQYSSFLSQS